MPSSVPVDPWVLQHDNRGTIHRFRNDRSGPTRCGNGNNGGRYSRKRLSKAEMHPQAHHCDTSKKCGKVI